VLDKDQRIDVQDAALANYIARGKKRQSRDKAEIEADVYTAALERVERTYDLFDNIVVAFSGGKDSTAVLNVVLEVARRRGRLPVDTVFYDEECCSPETIDYVRRMAASPEIKLEWLCLPVMHRNSCSTKSPYWYPWDSDCPELWVRELPPEGITRYPGFIPTTIPAHAPGYFQRKLKGTIAIVMGIRADESLVRRRGVTKRKEDNYIAGTPVAGVSTVKPIYDWKTSDVWTAPKKFGWDYNRSYDFMDKAGISPASQRIAPPFGEQPMAGLWQWQICWPELWDKMVERVPGVAAAARYATSELYGGSRNLWPPKGMSWEDGIQYYLAKHPLNIQTWAARRIQGFMRIHYNDTSDPIPEIHAHPTSGLSWRLLLRTAMLGDLKSRTDPRMRAQDPLGRKRGNDGKNGTADTTAGLDRMGDEGQSDG